MAFRFNQYVVSIILLGIGASAFAQPVLLKTEQKIEEYKLDNGLRIVLAENDKENKVYMSTIYRTGSLNDPKGKGGLAHLLEHLAFKGTQNIKGEEFQRRLNQYTLSNNASTDYYSTKYINVIRPEKNAINEIIHLEAERMDKLVLQEKFVPSEIAIVKREREVRLDQPFSVLIDQVFKTAYGNQHLGRLPIGDLNELQTINMGELNTFYRNWYAPNNATLIISGKFDKAEVLKQIDEKFSPIAARNIPQQAKVPTLDNSKFANKTFVVQKGSDLAKYNIYLTSANEKIKTALAMAPTLYTLQPSGHLYQSIVESGTATAVPATTWLDKDFNMVFMGAVYAPNHNEKTVQTALNNGVEQNKPFTDIELNRIKKMTINQADSIKNSASALGSRLGDYAVAYDGDWSKYFKDLEEVQNLKVDEVNQVYKSFLTPQNRIIGDIKPTPEDQKKALKLDVNATDAKTLDVSSEKPEPLKDISTYKKEVSTFVEASKKHIETTEQKIERGEFKNGVKYALYPTSTRDDKTYATIHVDFGTAESLFNKGQVVDLMAYLMLRGSDKYSLQDIADKSIEAGGGVSASGSANGVNIQVVAKKEKFEEFFKFAIELMKAPKFEQTQFDLIKSQSLSSLDRPYTEPDMVSALTITRILEKFQPGDLRYHFEPEFAKKQLEAATNEQVKALYQQFFAMNHSQIAVTGDFDAKKMKKLLKAEFSKWNGKETYEKLITPYSTYSAQKHHMLAEQRKFGSYVSVMPFPVGQDHPDRPALVVFGNILGVSQLSSRLAQELREKNALVYGFGSTLNFNDNNDSGALGISANYTAGKAAQVSQAVHKVLNDLLKNGVTEQEVEAAKAEIFKKRVTALEDERRIHSMLAPQLERGRDLYAREKQDQDFAKVTKADVDAAIKKYIKLDQFVEVMSDQYGKAAK